MSSPVSLTGVATWGMKEDGTALISVAYCDSNLTAPLRNDIHVRAVRLIMPPNMQEMTFFTAAFREIYHAAYHSSVRSICLILHSPNQSDKSIPYLPADIQIRDRKIHMESYDTVLANPRITPLLQTALEQIKSC